MNRNPKDDRSKNISRESRVSKVEIDSLREKVTDRVASNPEKAAKVLAFWLHGRFSAGRQVKKPAA